MIEIEKEGDKPAAEAATAAAAAAAEIESEKQTRIKRHLNFYCWFAAPETVSCDFSWAQSNRPTDQSLFQCKYFQKIPSLIRLSLAHLSIKLCDWKTWFSKTVRIFCRWFVSFYDDIIEFLYCWLVWTNKKKTNGDIRVRLVWNQNRNRKYRAHK